MALRKCPKCELNYLRGEEEICRVCATARDRKRPAADVEEIILCFECGEQPALHGKELCEDCLREQRRQADLELLADKVRAGEADDPIEESFDTEDDEDEED